MALEGEVGPVPLGSEVGSDADLLARASEIRVPLEWFEALVSALRARPAFNRLDGASMVVPNGFGATGIRLDAVARWMLAKA